MNRTLILYKPDLISRGLVDVVTKKIVLNNFKIIKSSLIYTTEDKILEHYKKNLLNQPKEIEKRLLSYMANKYIIALILEKENAIESMRKLIGASDPSKADKNTIRGYWGNDSYEKAMKENRSCYNLIHASDSVEEYKREKKIWFLEEEN